MMHDPTPYPGYKDSGVPWLGRIPKHWDFVRMKYLFSERVQKGFPNEPLLAATQTKGVIPKALYENRTVVALKDLHLLKLVELGDYVISLRSFEGGIERAHYRGIISPAYTVLTPSPRALREFFEFFFKSPGFVSGLSLCVTGIREGQNIDYARLGRTLLPVPPEEEQLAIGHFLQGTLVRIATVIRAKRRLIELLNGQKQAIIQRAVTRGLDPDVRFGPSGIPWLGDVPEHWSTTRLKFEASQIVDCLHATPEYMEDGPYPAIRTADVEPGKLRLSQARRVSAEQYALWTSRLVPQEGDILYSREGERYGIAALVPPRVRLCISQRMMIVRIRPTQTAAFFMWQLNCPHVLAQASADIIGATSPHVNVERIRNFQLVIPPQAQQQEIAAWIAQHTRGLESTIDRAEREIVNIREYRACLIADVVTGKLDVRGIDVPAIEEQADALEEESGIEAIEHPEADNAPEGDEVPA
jgi:type I restriction enzyme, S subunit